MKRRLEGKEMVISVKNLDRMREELEYNEYQKKICEMKLEEGLRIEMMKQIRDYKTLKREFEAEVGILKDKIKVVEEQIRNGVDIEDNKLKLEEKNGN